MTYLVSISSRGLIYIPKAVQKKMKFGKHTKIELIEENGGLTLKPVRDIMDFAGSLKNKKMPDNFDFREYMEKNYKRI